MHMAFAHGIIVPLVSRDNNDKRKLPMEDLRTRERAWQMFAAGDSGRLLQSFWSRIYEVGKWLDPQFTNTTEGLFHICYKNKADVKGWGEKSKQNQSYCISRK